MSYENGQQDAWLEAMRESLRSLRDDWRLDIGGLRDDVRKNREEVTAVQVQVAQIGASIKTREEALKAAASREQARLTRRVTIISMCVSAAIGVMAFIWRAVTGK